jgi:hypothetical protein
VKARLAGGASLSYLSCETGADLRLFPDAPNFSVLAAGGAGNDQLSAVSDEKNRRKGNSPAERGCPGYLLLPLSAISL